MTAACLVLVANRRSGEAVRLAGSVAAGAVVTGGAALAVAWMRGTSPARLWDALVIFRIQAGGLVSAYGSRAGDTTHRLHVLLQALALSGAPLVGVVALLAARRPTLALTPGRSWGLDLRWLAVPVIGWELVGVLLGGSYWPHYLIGLIPGLVLLVSAVEPPGDEPGAGRAPAGWRRRLVAASLAVAACSATIAFAGVLLHPPVQSDDAKVSAYLASHRQAGDTVVVAFGHPNIVYDAGVTSPYEHLWSLSARVRDARLAALIALMGRAGAPQWIVVAGTSLGTWGVDATLADQVLHEHYRMVTTAGDWHVFERDTAAT